MTIIKIRNEYVEFRLRKFKNKIKSKLAHLYYLSRALWIIGHIHEQMHKIYMQVQIVHIHETRTEG